MQRAKLIEALDHAEQGRPLSVWRGNPPGQYQTEGAIFDGHGRDQDRIRVRFRTRPGRWGRPVLIDVDRVAVVWPAAANREGQP